MKFTQRLESVNGALQATIGERHESQVGESRGFQACYSGVHIAAVRNSSKDVNEQGQNNWMTADLEQMSLQYH